MQEIDARQIVHLESNHDIQEDHTNKRQQKMEGITHNAAKTLKI